MVSYHNRKFQNNSISPTYQQRFSMQSEFLRKVFYIRPVYFLEYSFLSSRLQSPEPFKKMLPDQGVCTFLAIC